MSGLQESLSLIASQPVGGNRMISSNFERSGGKNKLKRPRTAPNFHYPCILYSSCRCFSFFFGEVSPGLVLSLQRDRTLSWLHWKVLMLDVKRSGSHLGKKKESDTLVLQLSQERNGSVCVCVCVCVRVCVCVCASGGSGKWLVINTSDTPGLPSTFHSRVFCGLVTFSSSLSTFLELCLHLREALL